MTKELTSLDPTAWVNIENEKVNPTKFAVSNKIKARPSEENPDELAKAEAVCRELMARGANIAESYDDYVRLGFALAEGLGSEGSEIYHQLCSKSSKYNHAECEKQWQDCLKNGNGSITIATFYKMAQEAGVDQKTVAVQEDEQQEEEDAEKSDSNNKTIEEMTLSEIYDSNIPPKMPVKKPKLVENLLKPIPEIFKDPVAQAAFPSLAIHTKGLRFPYIDNLERELRMNCLLVGVTGGGKDTCVKMLINHIMSDIKQRDEVNRQRLVDFNKDYNSKASNQTKPQRPDDLIIQIIKSDVTKAALYQRMDEAQGAPLYVRISEIEQWDKIEEAKGATNQFTTLKLADDEDNDFGADRAGTQSVTVSGSLFLNWNANATISKVLKYFKYVVIDGPISRLCMGMLPEQAIGSDIPVFGEFDATYDKRLRPYLNNLKHVSGSIKCKKALELVNKLKQECDEFSVLTQDAVYDNLTHRALVHAFRKACLLYVANGCKWEQSIESFCRWSLHYDLWIKMKLWGDAIRKAESEVTTSKRGPKNLLERIDADQDGIFKVDALVKLKNQGFLNGSVRNLISQWKSRKYILQITNDTFKKIK